MNTLMIQTHSPVNEKLYRATLPNHLDYASIHRYDMLQIDQDYLALLHSISYIKENIKNYKTIFTIGSDVIISDMNKPISYFEDDNYGIIISKEDLGGSPTNGDFIIWQNNQKTLEAIDKIEEILLQIPGNSWGVQQTFNMMMNTDFGNTHIKYLECRQLQSSPFSRFPSYAWQEGDFSIHFLNMSNDEKYTKCNEFITNRRVLWCN